MSYNVYTKAASVDDSPYLELIVHCVNGSEYDIVLEYRKGKKCIFGDYLNPAELVPGSKPFNVSEDEKYYKGIGFECNSNEIIELNEIDLVNIINIDHMNRNKSKIKRVKVNIDCEIVDKNKV